MTYRRIIIPKGTIISNQTTIIRVPYNLDADAVVVGPKHTTILESDTLSNALPINYVVNNFTASRVPDIISNNPDDTIVLPVKIVMPSKKYNKYFPTGRGQIYHTPSKIRKRQVPYDNRLTPLIYSTDNSKLLTDVNSQYEDSSFFSSKIDEQFYNDKNKLFDHHTNTFPSLQYGNDSRSLHESYLNIKPYKNEKAPNTIQKSLSNYSRNDYLQINPIKTKFNRFGSPNRTYITSYAFNESPYSNRNFDTRWQSPDFYFPVQHKTEIQEVDHNDNLHYNFTDEFSKYVTISKRDFTQMFPEIAQNNQYLSSIYEEDTDVYTEEDDEENKNNEIESNPIRSGSCHQPINNPIRGASLNINSSEEDSQMEIEALFDNSSSDMKYK